MADSRPLASDRARRAGRLLVCIAASLNKGGRGVSMSLKYRSNFNAMPRRALAPYWANSFFMSSI